MKKTFVLIDTNLPINNRNQKIIDTLLEYNSTWEIHVITWNRDNVDERNLSNYHLYQKESKLGDRLKKLQNLWGFRQFVQQTILDINPDVIIASHWDTLICVPKKRKTQKLFYENLDIPTGPWWMRLPIRLIEHFSLRSVNLIIHASRFYQPLYPKHIPQVILENKPSFKVELPTYTPHPPLKITFIGGVRYFEVLKNLIDAVRDNKAFELYFHGGGTDLDIAKSYAQEATNIRFTGPYNYADIQQLYFSSDIIWAVYPNKNYNVKYAISNKFHESLLLGIPCVYADNTCLGDFVQQHNIGLVVNPYDVHEIKQLLNNIQKGTIDLKQIRKSMLQFVATETTWNKDFNQIILYI